jgi:hypothetical protein
MTINYKQPVFSDSRRKPVKTVMKLTYLLTAFMIFLSCSRISPVITPGSTTSNSPSDPAGTELMTVSMIYPATTGARRDANIVLSFSDVVDFTTLTGALTITGSLSGPHGVFSGISADSTVYSINPSTDFTNSETVTVSVADSVLSTGGTALYTGEGPTPPPTIDFIFTVAATTAQQPAVDFEVVPASRYPAPAATGTRIYLENIYVAFTQPAIVQLADYTITGSISGSVEDISGPVDVNGDGYVWALPVTTPLSYGETVTVQLSAGITDITTLIPLDVSGTYDTWSFTTETAPAAYGAFGITGSVNVKNVTQNSATIEWKTTQSVLDTQSTVYYGTSTAYGSTTSEGATGTAYFQSHSITLTGLAAGTRYYFRTYSTDGATPANYYGSFITDFGATPASNPGIPACDSGGDNSAIFLLENIMTPTAHDGSAYFFWLNGGNVYAHHADTAGSLDWSADGDQIDSNGTTTSVSAFSDRSGRAVVIMADGSDIRAKLVYDDGSGTMNFFDSWGGAATAWGGTAAATGKSIGTGTSCRMAVVWGTNEYIYNGYITSLISGNIERDTTLSNPFYDFSNNLSSVASSGDHVLNTSSDAHATLPPSAIYRHAIGQSSAAVTAPAGYIIASDTDSAGAAVADHDTWDTGNPAVHNTTYSNPLLATPSANVYTAHGYNPVQGTWTVDANDIFYDDTSSYRYLSAVAGVNFAASNSIYYTGNANDAFDSYTLVDTTKTFITDGTVAVGDLVENTTVAGHATVTAIISEHELELSDPIITATGQSYEIYGRIDSGTSTNVAGDEARVLDGTATFIADVAAGDIVRDNDTNLSLANDDQYTTISTIVSDNWLELASSIMETGSNAYLIYDQGTIYTGTTYALPGSYLFDSDASFVTDGIGHKAIVAENLATTSYALISDVFSDSLLNISAGFMTAGGQQYQVHTGTYCNTHFAATPFSSFYHITLDNTINVNLATFTIYNRILSGTAGTPPSILSSTISVDPLYASHTRERHSVNTPVGSNARARWLPRPSHALGFPRT